MSESMSNVERGLWRIAELGARCSQQSAAGSRGPLWEELEQTIAGLEADFEAARQAVDIAPAQVRSLEGRLNVAKKERDREKARADECSADAEAARRERDRAGAKAAKAVAAVNEARAAAAEAQTVAAEASAKATAAQAALDQALTARDHLVATLDETVAARDRIMAAVDEAEDCIARLESRMNALEVDLEAARTERDAVRAEREAMEAERDAARTERDVVRADREAMRAERDAARTERDEVVAERDAVVAAQREAVAERADALDTLAARADGAVVVLPGVALPKPAGPVAPAARVSWHPTWSEWADDDADEPAPAPTAGTVTEPVVAVAPVLPTVDVEVDVADDDTSLFDPADDEVGVRYLNVAATIGQLLPEDLGPLLLAGATVVRREGRLFATVAVSASPWAAPGSESDEQAQKLADAGLRVEWTTDAPMAC